MSYQAARCAIGRKSASTSVAPTTASDKMESIPPQEGDRLTPLFVITQNPLVVVTFALSRVERWRAVDIQREQSTAIHPDAGIDEGMADKAEREQIALYVCKVRLR